MTVLSLQHINKRFEGRQVINDLSLQLESGKIYALIGENGAGKTTLLNLINGQVACDSGAIQLKEKNIIEEPTNKRANMGIVRLWQHSNLFQNMTVLNNLLVVPKSKGEHLRFYFSREARKEQQEHRRFALEILKELELSDKANNLGKELSFGQQRLVAFGRIMMDSRVSTHTPLLILADEPFAGVHESLIKKISQILRNLADIGHTILMIEHNIKQAKLIADEILKMESGKVHTHMDEITMFSTSNA